MDRRGFLLSGAALSLLGCAGTPPAPRATDPGLLPQPNAAYRAWVDAFRARARAAGITAATLDAGFRGQGFLPGVIERDRAQTEFTRTLEDYLAIVAPEPRIAAGRQAAAQQRQTLARIEDRFGVPGTVLAAIWGVESNFGARRGEIPVISSTSTLAFEGRRGRFFEANLIAALRILQDGDTTPDRLVGSWAGAMGHTQFIPATYERLAVDFDGDGRRDIWSDDPTDALASAAALLRDAGWQRGGATAVEVRLPATLDGASTDPDTRRSAGAWQGLGVMPARPGALPEGTARLLQPMGAGTPAFLAYRNFERILRYNASTLYGLGVSYLAGRLAGEGPLVTPFGPDRFGLTRADRTRLQGALNAAGFDAGTPDGVFGRRTGDAIAAFQRSLGLPATGEPTRAVVAALL